MSSPFLNGFCGALVHRLCQSQRVEIRAQSEARVVAFVAGRLHDARHGSSLISTLSDALIRCPEVEELYADEAELKDLIEELGAASS